MDRSTQPRAYGRKTIPKSRQVQLPKDLLEDIGMAIGDSVYVLGWGRWAFVIPAGDLDERLERLFTETLAPLLEAAPEGT